MLTLAGSVILLVIVVLGAALALVVAYPFSVVARRADDRTSSIQRRLNTPGYVLKRVWG